MSDFFIQKIAENLNTTGDRLCCNINGINIPYSEFGALAGSVQTFLKDKDNKHVGVVICNSHETYAAMVGCWLSSKAYVPLNLDYPIDRIKAILEDAEIEWVFYDQNQIGIQDFATQLPNKRFISIQSLPFSGITAPKVNPGDHAYVLFTSGTTGKPKGVPISFANLDAFVQGFQQLGYSIQAEDRFLQMFELTFDLSVMCFAIPLVYNASFYTLNSKLIKTLALYNALETHNITVSLMVPSAIQLLLPYLDDIELPQLRVSQFCGEALKADLVQKWAPCAPNAVIDNVYGPTEATIYCTTQRIELSKLDQMSHYGVVHIGKDMANVETAIFNHGVRITDCQIEGELCISGPQITKGYLNNPEQNKLSFFNVEGKIYYKTGDLAKYSDSGNLVYLGRTDDQVKIQGYRIEMAEVEMAMHEAVPEYLHAAVTYEDQNGQTQIAIYTQCTNEVNQDYRELLKIRLPEYMLPQLFLQIESFPFNSNGKTDRKKLKNMLFEQITSHENQKS